MKIFINPGHGDKLNGTYDPGAIGATGLHEAKVNEVIGCILESKLIKAGIDTYYYQSGDLEAITTRANIWKADYFVSIHANAFSDRKAQGIETWYYSDSPRGQNLAQSIQTSLVKSLGRVDRGIKATTSFYVIRNTAMPAVLAEIGFISNPAEEALMMIEEWWEDAAEALARGICSYVGVAYPEPEPGPESEPEPEAPKDLETGEPGKQTQEPEPDPESGPKPEPEPPEAKPQKLSLWRFFIEILKEIAKTLKR